MICSNRTVSWMMVTDCSIRVYCKLILCKLCNPLCWHFILCQHNWLVSVFNTYYLLLGKTSWCCATSKNQAPCTMHKYYMCWILPFDAFRFRVLNNLINNLFHNSWITWISWNMLSSVAKDAYLINCSKTTHYAQNYLLDCFIVFLSCYSSSGLLFIFICVSMAYAHFPNDKIRTPWMPMRPSILFFSCRMPDKLTRKAGFEICGRLLRPVFDWERNTPSRQSLCTCVWV